MFERKNRPETGGTEAKRRSVQKNRLALYENRTEWC